MPGLVYHNPTAITVTTSTQNVLVQADGGGVGATGLRAGALFQNQHATTSINLRFGSASAAPYVLAAGAAFTDTTSQSAVYADVASGTATLFVTIIK